MAKSTSTVTAAVVETSLISFAITLNDNVVPAQLVQTSVSSLMVDRAPVAESICKKAQPKIICWGPKPISVLAISSK